MSFRPATAPAAAAAEAAAAETGGGGGAATQRSGDLCPGCARDLNLYGFLGSAAATRFFRPAASCLRYVLATFHARKPCKTRHSQIVPCQTPCPCTICGAEALMARAAARGIGAARPAARPCGPAARRPATASPVFSVHRLVVFQLYQVSSVAFMDGAVNQDVGFCNARAKAAGMLPFFWDVHGCRIARVRQASHNSGAVDANRPAAL